MAARPFVVAEQHRAVLDGDLSAVVLGERHDVRPDPLGLLPVGVLVLRAVRAHEGVDVGHAHRLGGSDDVLQVADDLGAMLGVRMKRVRVIAEAGDGEAL